MATGCGGPKKTPPRVEPPPTDPGVRRVVETGPIDLEAGRDDGTIAWKLHGKSSRLGLQDAGEKQVFAQGVTGEIFDKGKVASRFTSQDAKAASESKQMVLMGKVRIDSVTQNVSLYADKVAWMEERQMFSAQGNVRIDSPGWELGKMEEVWATPDLSKFGTPDKFK